VTELDSYNNSEHNRTVQQASKSQVASDLAVQITAGDSSASNKFVQLNYQWLLFIIRKKFSNSNNHEDIVQDTFILVINHLQQGKVLDLTAVLAYLRSTAINIGFDYLRKDSKFVSALNQELIEAIEDAKNDVLSTMIWNDKVKYAKQVLNELKIPRDKEILNRFYFKDQSKTSICKELNLESIHFDRVLYRAKERLKELIQKKNDTPQQNNFKTRSTQRKKSKSTNAFFTNNSFVKLLILAPVFCCNTLQKLIDLNTLSHIKGVRNDSF